MKDRTRSEDDDDNHAASLRITFPKAGFSGALTFRREHSPGIVRLRFFPLGPFRCNSCFLSFFPLTPTAVRCTVVKVAIFRIEKCCPNTASVMKSHTTQLSFYFFDSFYYFIPVKFLFGLIFPPNANTRQTCVKRKRKWAH